MKTKHSMRIVCTIVISALAVLALFLIPNNSSKKTPYNFERKFFRENIYPIEQIRDIQLNSYYIAGNSTNELFLANPTSLRSILVSNISSLDTEYFRIKVKDFHKYLSGSYKTIVDPPRFFMMDGTQPAIIKGEIASWSAKAANNQKEFFTLALPVSENSYVMRSVSNRSNTNVLYVEKENPYQLISNDQLLQAQVDGLFCTDGMLLLNKKLNRIIYLYYYRNEIILADTNLNLQARLKTIDPIDSAAVEVTMIDSENALVLAKPPLLVNKLSCTFNEWLFVNSGLLASNDDRILFDEGSVIDVYNLERQAYKFSFYLPSYNGSKLKDFRVVDGCLLALYGKYIVKFKLNPRHYEE